MGDEISVSRLRSAYARGEKIMPLLAAERNGFENDFSAIQVAYDLQAGEYTAWSNTTEGNEFYAKFAAALFPFLGDANSLLDAGVGEATRLKPILEYFPELDRLYAFDASVSRMLWAKRNLSSVLSSSAREACLFVADTAEIPLPNASVELVLSMHSVEPNGGREHELLAELLRVAARRLILIEPTTKFASEAQIRRMNQLGYCMNLPDVLVELGANVIIHEPWPVCANPDNASEIIVVEIAPDKAMPRETQIADLSNLELVAPSSLSNLEPVSSGLYSRRDGLLFPSVAGFPVLCRRNAVIATQLLDAT